MLGAVGATAIDLSTAEVTVSEAVALIPEVVSVAVIVVVPTAFPVATPVMETLAMVASAEVHPTLAVRSFVEPSEYVPVATNAWVVPFAIDAGSGVSAIEVSLASVTTSGTDAVTVLESVALTVVVPAATPFAFPVASIQVSRRLAR